MRRLRIQTSSAPETAHGPRRLHSAISQRGRAGRRQEGARARYTGGMKTRHAFAAAAILAVTGLGYAAQAQQAASPKVVVYKSPT